MSLNSLHIIPIHSFILILDASSLAEKHSAANANFVVFGLIQSGLEPIDYMYHT